MQVHGKKLVPAHLDGGEGGTVGIMDEPTELMEGLVGKAVSLGDCGGDTGGSGGS